MTIDESQNSKAEQLDGSGDDHELHSVSAEFSAELSMGGSPNFPEWLAKVAPERQGSLLKKLNSVA